jgi:hypothetical protein
VANDLDCNDNNANINPNTVWYQDNDGDGFGNALISQVGCAQPSGFVLNNTDCNDNDNTNTVLNPSFNQVGPFNMNASISDLPTTSNNGVTGTWSPAINNTATTLYTFTPSVGQCANTATMTIVINNVVQDAFHLSNANGTYSQNFNALANSGSTSTWTNNSTVPYWYAQLGSTTTLSTIRINSGTSTTNGLQSFGSVESTDRALGSLNGTGSSVSNNYAYGVLFQNTSGTAINALQVSYTLEQWNRNNNAAAQNMVVSYRIQNSPITQPQASSNAGWIQVPALTAVTPQTGSGTIALDGNIGANRMVISNVNVPSFILQPNEYLMVRWVDNDASGTDHGLAIDDVSIVWQTLITSYQDADGDGFGNPNVVSTAQTLPAGYVLNNDDCDDTDPELNPMTEWYADLDGDGYGNAAVIITSCTQPEGYLRNDEDCDDNDATVTVAVYWYRDLDNDGYGDPGVSLLRCFRPNGYVANNTDCNDNSASVNPTTVWFKDADNDGFGNPLITTTSCLQPLGYVSNNTDCNDNVASIGNTSSLAAPTGISGPQGGLCFGIQNSASYSVSNVFGALTYSWEVPTGMFISSGANTSSIVVSINENYVGGIITVRGQNICTEGERDTLQIYTLPPVSIAISGDRTICLQM